MYMSFFILHFVAQIILGEKELKVTMKRHLVLTLIYIIDTVDVVLRMLGIKLCKLDKQSIMGSLSPEAWEETQKSDMVDGFNAFLIGLERDERLTLWRYILCL